MQRIKAIIKSIYYQKTIIAVRLNNEGSLKAKLAGKGYVLRRTALYYR